MISPYKRSPKVPPVGLLRSDRRVVLEDGSTRGLFGLDPAWKLRVYADRETVRPFVVAGQGEAIRWNDTWIRWETGGPSVTLLGGYIGQDDEAAAGLFAWRGWLKDEGACVGSTGAASMSLLRATLARPLLVNGGDPPPLGEVIGGRQQAGVPPGHYAAFAAWDMQAAYTRTMGNLIYPPWWIGTNELPADEELPSFARARVSIPPRVPWGPLPKRRRAPLRSGLVRRMAHREYPGGRIQGIWSGAELRAARAAGCTVKVLQAWIMIGRPTRPFVPWLEAVERGREMPGVAGLLAKMTGNALWGRVIYFGERTGISFRDRSFHVRKLPIPGHGIPATDIAELVCSSVRARLYTDAIMPHAARVLSVHTDGALIADSDFGVDFPPDWRMKDHGSNLTYIGPQAYAYTPSDSSGLKIKLAGTPPADSLRVWKALKNQVLRPGSDLPDPAAVRALTQTFPALHEQLLAGHR